MERSLMEIVLRGSILDRNPGAISERAYQSMVDLVAASVLPEMAHAESEELLHFFRLMSGYETERLKYFQPLLKHLLKKLQSEILLAVDEGSPIARYEEASEALRSIIRRVEIRLNENEEALQVPSEQGSEKIKKLESSIDEKLTQIIALQKEILALKKSPVAGPSAPTIIDTKSQELETHQEETIRLFKKALSR